MDDLISRQAAIDKVEPWLKCDSYGWGERNVLKAVLYELRFLPTAEPRKGRWMHDGSRWENRWICSKCGYKWFFECARGMFCPNCGARMCEQ